MDAMPQVAKPSHSIEEIERMRDPVVQARAADEFLAYAESRAKSARTLRDMALRKARESGVSRPQLADRTGINIHTIKAVTRL